MLTLAAAADQVISHQPRLVSVLADALPWWLLLIAAIIAGFALLMTLWNIALFPRTRTDAAPAGQPSVSVCIPMRNEQTNVVDCIAAILASDYSNLLVLVYDDQSDDQTPELLKQMMQRDSRVRVVPTRPLPAGWVGKQWACWQLGQAATTDRMLFIDADVRLETDCLRRALAAQDDRAAALISTFPRQVCGTLGEALLVPLIHFILLSYLPFVRMRSTGDPNACAACGQFILVSRDAYTTLGGHSSCMNSMHEGVKMPRVFRKAGFKTDLFDGTDIVSCRMYRGLAQTWRGFAKNAFEGLGSIGLLVFITIMHAVGHVLPWLVLAILSLSGDLFTLTGLLAAIAVAFNLVQRFTLAGRFQQSFLSALLHPLGVAMMTIVQWHSLILARTGKRGWRGRTLGSQHAPQPSAS